MVESARAAAGAYGFVAVTSIIDVRLIIGAVTFIRKMVTGVGVMAASVVLALAERV